MAYTAPRTWTVGQILTAAQLNTDVRDNMLFVAGSTGYSGAMVQLLASDVTVTNVNNTAAKTSLGSLTIPAGALGTTREAILRMIADYKNESGSNRNLDLDIELGGTQVANLQFPSIASQATVYRSVGMECWITALNATNAQRALAMAWMGTTGGTAGNPPVTGQNGYFIGPLVHKALAKDSTAALTMEVFATHSAAGVSIDFNCYSLHLELH